MVWHLLHPKLSQTGLFSVHNANDLIVNKGTRPFHPKNPGKSKTIQTSCNLCKIRFLQLWRTMFDSATFLELPKGEFILPMLYSHHKFETPGRTITLQLPQRFFQALPPRHAMHWHRYRRLIRRKVRRSIGRIRHGRESRGSGMHRSRIGLEAACAAFPRLRKT